MSSIAPSLSVQTRSRVVTSPRFAMLAPATVAAAVLANVAVYVIGSGLVAYDSQFLPLASVSGAIIMTVAPAIVAVLLYAALRRFTHHPARIFTSLSAIVFALTLIPVFTYIPTVPGWTGAQSGILVIMHAVAAGVIVGLLTWPERSAAR